MKGTLFSADFVADSNGNLRLLELNTDTGIIVQELSNFNFDEFFAVLSSNQITTLDIIYKPYIHQLFVEELSSKINLQLPSVTTINLHDENIDSIYPSSVADTGDNFILRLAYDESAIFDSIYCKNRLNTFNLFTDSSITDYCVSYYHSSNRGVYDTLTREINESNIPDITVKDIDEVFNPIDFFKLSVTGTSEDAWNNFLAENASEDKVIEQYHFNPNFTDENGYITSIRFFGIVYGAQLQVLPLHSYQISAIFQPPASLDLEENSQKVRDHHYYEFTTNFLKSDSYGILSTHEILMGNETWSKIDDVQVGDQVKSYYIAGRPNTESDSESLTWEYDGGEFPTGSHMAESSVIYRQESNLKYSGMMEMIIDGDSMFSGINKKYLVFDSTINKSSFKAISAINAVTDYLYDLNGDLIQIDELNFYVTTSSGLKFVELDVEDTDTYIINGSTAFNSIVSHNAPCFVAGTQISMENGLTKNIEDVVIGDRVISFDLQKNEPKVSEVINIFSKKVNKVVEYTFLNGFVLKATLDHPIFVVGKGWCSHSEKISNSLYQLNEPVKKIEIGDIVKLQTDETELTNIELIDETYTVYNLSEIKPFHNYFANNILVHNRPVLICFVGGTKITLSNGDIKNIEDVVVGEEVLTYNEKNGKKEKGIVGNLSQHEANSVVKIIFDDENIIITTKEHPFFVKGKGWVKAGQLQKMDVCKKVDGNLSSISQVQELQETHTVYNLLSVSENHNFYANGILVHNK